MNSQKNLMLQVDGVITDHEFGSFGTVYNALVESLRVQERIIVSIIINGVEVLADKVESFPCNEVHHAIISTQQKNQFIQGLLESVTDYIPNLCKGIIKIANLLQADRQEESYELFVQAIEGLEWTNSCISGLLELCNEQRNDDLYNLNIKFHNHLLELEQAMELQSTTDIADILEYVLAPTLVDIGITLSDYSIKPV
ncbi:hypothetical protein [Effusibacillus consociatus]|uniref:DUF8042 domain-containing protein n=1 Tax=Effusibacillus consociatus TaxID=1117041 RepID=A0ABV9Q454_9BACL